MPSALVLALVFGLLACQKPPSQKAGSPDLTPPSDLSLPQPGEEAKSPFDQLRERIRKFTDLALDCDRSYFARVEPERIKKWELPVDVKAMEDECDPLLSQFEDLVTLGAFKHELLDLFLRKAAEVADGYLVLAFRCKKVGVRDKIPYIREVSALRDNLRQAVASLEETAKRALSLDDKDFEALNLAKPQDRLAISHKAFLALRDDFERYIKEPLKNEKPTARYNIRLSERLAQRALNLLQGAGPQGQAILGPAEALTHAFSQAANFFTGDYFNAEGRLVRKVILDFERADRAYRRAAASIFRREKVAP